MTENEKSGLRTGKELYPRLILLIVAIGCLALSLIYLSDMFIVISFAFAAFSANYMVAGMRDSFCYKGQSASPEAPKTDPYADLERYESENEE